MWGEFQGKAVKSSMNYAKTYVLPASETSVWFTVTNRRAMWVARIIFLLNLLQIIVTNFNSLQLIVSNGKQRQEASK